MRISIGFTLFISILNSCCADTHVLWDATNIPDPTSTDFLQCNLRTSGTLCDPNTIFTDTEIKSIANELLQLELQTRETNRRANGECDGKGVTGAVFVTKHVHNGAEQVLKEIANSMLHNWKLNQQCRKSFAIVVSVADKRFWVSKSKQFPVDGSKFLEIFRQQNHMLSTGNYSNALGQILQQITREIKQRQTGVADGKLSITLNEDTQDATEVYPLFITGSSDGMMETNGAQLEQLIVTDTVDATTAINPINDRQKRCLPVWTWFLPLSLLPVLLITCRRIIRRQRSKKGTGKSRYMAGVEETSSNESKKNGITQNSWQFRCLNYNSDTDINQTNSCLTSGQ